MWAQINPDDDTVERIFPRAQAFRLGDVNYPATTFSDIYTLRSLDILPVRRVQIGAPEDTLGWTSFDTYVVHLFHVEKQVTWTEDEDAQDQRDARAARQLRAVWGSKRLEMEDFLYAKGYVSERELTPADLIEFKAQ